MIPASWPDDAFHRTDGGPAFPSSVSDEQFSREGMSLRDHFAGLAMQGEIAGMDQDASLSRNEGETWDEAMARDVRRRAKFAYQNADAMLAERAKGQPVDPVAEAAQDLLAALEDVLPLAIETMKPVFSANQDRRPGEEWSVAASIASDRMKARLDAARAAIAKARGA